jgi:hypothetical protein
LSSQESFGTIHNIAGGPSLPGLRMLDPLLRSPLTLAEIFAVQVDFFFIICLLFQAIDFYLIKISGHYAALILGPAGSWLTLLFVSPLPFLAPV